MAQSSEPTISFLNSAVTFNKEEKKKKIERKAMTWKLLKRTSPALSRNKTPSIPKLCIDHKQNSVEEGEPSLKKGSYKYEPALVATTNQSFTIYRVPAYIRESRRMYYEPRILSIGPFHHDKPHLKEMKNLKQIYLHNFLSRSNLEWQTCLNVVTNQLPRIRSCYFETIYKLLSKLAYYKMTDDKLAKILLLDCCFILEFLFQWTKGKTIFENVGWLLPLVRTDLLMLENQIPFFLLQSLFDLSVQSINKYSNGENEMSSLVTICVSYLSNKKKVERCIPEISSIAHSDIYHLLHLYHNLSVKEPGLPEPDSKSLYRGLDERFKSLKVATKAVTCFRKKEELPQTSLPSRTPTTIPSATKLHESGVKFIKKVTDNQLDITFKKGILEIPFFSIEDSTKSRLVNLVSFEQSIPVSKRFLSSYVAFMDNIIDTEKDISILHECGILENKLTSDYDAAVFFNQLAESCYIDFDKHYLAGLFKDVNIYSSSNWHGWRAKLRKDYFSNPWAIISFGAAVLLLILTFLQTFYGMYGYHHPPQS